MSDSLYDVLGIGNAIVDVLSQADEAFLEREALAKGSMTLIDDTRAAALYQAMGPGREVSGGSAANTMVGLAALGVRSGFIGKVRDDQLGEIFRHDIRSAGVAFDTPAAQEGAATARCLVLVTEDAQRTMATFLGASVGLTPADVSAEAVAGSDITYLEGYLWDAPPAKEAFLKAAELAHGAGRQVALSLSDPFCVDRHRESFRALVEDHVDLLFANEAEITSLYQVTYFDEALEAVKGRCRVAALTRSEKGAVILTDDAIEEVAAAPVAQVVDTTGAGDLFAAGFMAGLARNLSPRDCGRLGALAASEVLSHYGARPETSLPALAAEHGLLS